MNLEQKKRVAEIAAKACLEFGVNYEVVYLAAEEAILAALADPLLNPKEWVGLTDEEILDIVGRAGAGYPAVVPPYTRDLFKKIEDKLREKNGG